MKYGCVEIADVLEGWSAHSASSRRRKGMSRRSRANDLRDLTYRLEHRPTGVSVEGSIPTGHYARKEMIRLREKLRAELWTELESQVARALRLPGR